ncbi:hypothetical protein Ctob_000564 [Chrysochromulina tobinii]|uniref:Uncharacterized protein n=1 Tax=Chrysochromulina tobinii TaxID=1460289 RepID=A0A0M0J6V4_9EUKA|nr:hypothetical protein Ctob_000564 [Chrysochromulina tobinii]|eukprot:KOO22062.1 hypothetical protein Ctob_000564 [Chrysochromulina sp. CCMP291]
MAGIDPTLRAWAGGDLEADQPRVRHFHILEETSDFLSAAGGGRAIGFFGSVEQTEHTIFLTVAKQLVDDSRPVELRPLLGRANIGRGTSGATVYLSPRGSALASNGSAVPSLLLHEYRVPQLPGDTAVVERWRRLQGAREASGTASSGTDAASSTSSALPPASEMWHSVLEAEALSLHQFLERGALPDVTQLAPNGTALDTALDVLMAMGTAASAAGPITPKASSVGAALSAAAVAASSWRVRAVVGKVDQGAMEGVVEEMRAIRGRQGAGGRQGADPTRASTRKPEKHDEL